jgi:V/A-type H+/Na+-transporting ATPase subunit I
MLLRPACATWFELLTPREELAAALRCLADTGQVELQSRSDISAAHWLPTLRVAVDEYRHLAERYSQYWPAAASTPANRERKVEELAAAALNNLRIWAASADPLITRLQQLTHERSQLELLRPLLSQQDAALPNLRLFAQPGPILASRIYLMGVETGVLEIPTAVLTHSIHCNDSHYLLAVGPVRDIETFDESLNARKARRLELPTQLTENRDAALAATAARGARIATESNELGEQLAQLSRVQDCAGALADLRFIEWLTDHVPELTGTEHFAWITGWTSDPGGARVEEALRRARLHSLMHFPEGPLGVAGPVVLRNPPWVQPFEVFARLLGVPAASEADPSAILALIAPLMFGFMFGDVGQGALLVIGGAILRKRYPATALLIPGGIAAMIFGVLFGSIFAREDIIPALWLRPMEHPLPLLGVSLAGGSCVILVGLALEALESYWAGTARLWWSTRAGLVLCYLGAVGCVFDRHALWALPVGLAWYCTGSSLQSPSARLGRLGASIGESLETLMQLIVNTFSFVRVGAFALAHAGLASTISSLAAGVSSRTMSWIALLLGNALVIVIEGMIVGIQTTRLVLFEFFIRFLRGSGRPFHPLPSPAAPTNTIEPSRKSP